MSSDGDEPRSFRIRGRAAFPFSRSRSMASNGVADAESGTPSDNEGGRTVYRIGGSIIHGRMADGPTSGTSTPKRADDPPRPGPEAGDVRTEGVADQPPPLELPNRTIRFPDEAPASQESPREPQSL